jgi:hypothetical protein
MKYSTAQRSRQCQTFAQGPTNSMFRLRNYGTDILHEAQIESNHFSQKRFKAQKSDIPLHI